MYIQFIIFLLLGLHLSAAAAAADIKCENGGKCMLVENCKGLYNILNDVNPKMLLVFIRRLHCSLDGKQRLKSKICCPLGFQEIKKGIDLLPNKTVCGTQTNDRIVGGERTDLDEHPWMVLIKYDKCTCFYGNDVIYKSKNYSKITAEGSSFSCGGVLISSRYVMTAAHCVKLKGMNWKVSQVRLGEWNLASRTDCLGDDCSPDPLNVDVEEIIAHERYNPDVDQQNDIALLRLARDIPFTDFVKPICLPVELSLRRNTFENYDMEVAGWGQTETRSMSDVKLKVTVTVRNTQDCQEVYTSANRIISENQLCAGGLKGQDSCRGDSGGALMGQVDVSKNWIALGLVSYGPSPCGTAGWPGVYTRVTSYVDWILSKIRP